MAVWSLLVLLATAPPAVEISTLGGDQHVGGLERLTDESAVLKSGTGSTTVAAADLLKVRIASATTPTADAAATIELRLVDGSLLRVTGFTTTATEAMATHSQLGPLKLPIGVVHSVRFAPPDAKVDAAWSELLGRSAKLDQLAVRKNDVLDHLDGVIGSLEESAMSFRLDGDEIPVKREKIFGLIYAKRESTAAKAAAAIDLSTGDRLAVKKVSWNGETWKATLVSGADLSISGSIVQSVDFSLSKIAYLSNLEPREVKYTPFWDIVWEYRRDRTCHGGPISVGNKVYAKGLGLHSRTLLKYRIGGDYRRFRTVMGIDDSLRTAGDVDVVIKGDGRTLFKGPVCIYERPERGATDQSEKRLMAPVKLDLDVTGVVELEIFVDYGEMLDYGDCLDLADAKLVK
jgi:NPCBM/NEW2 domain